jgi:hypothetical protein
MCFLSSEYLYYFGLLNDGWKEENGINDLVIPAYKLRFFPFKISVFILII